MISVRQASSDEWLVTVNGRATTTHRVCVTAADVARFPAAAGSAEKLLTASFEFLLEREPNTSILPSFDLMLMGQYFPEFPKELPKYVGS
jgi:hypothetical protein